MPAKQPSEETTQIPVPETASSPSGMKSSTKAIIAIVSVMFFLCLMGFILAFVIFSAATNSIEDGDYDEYYSDNWDIDFDEDQLSAADRVVADIMDQYDDVVDAAQDDSVSWEEYFEELDEMIVLMNQLNALEPDETLAESIELMTEARIEYGVAVDLNSNDPVDQAGVETASEIITEAEGLLVEYLEDRY